jgi:flagellar hook-basal body complex protein FliE
MAGLIFLEFQDPINQVAKRVSRQVYSTMGVFYTNYLTETPSIEVFIPKIYGDNDPLVGTSLDFYKNHPLVTKLSLSYVRDQYKKDFLSTFAVSRATVTIPSTDELLDLFMGIGSENAITYKNTGVGFINSIIKKIGLVSKFQKSNASSIDYEDKESILKTDLIIEYMKAFKSQIPAGEGNFLLCSYLIPNEVFEAPIEVSLASKNSSTYDMRPFQTKMVALSETFITKMSNNSIYNRDFVKAVINSFKNVQEEQKRAKKLLEAIIHKLNLGSQQSLANEIADKHDISWDKMMEMGKNLQDGIDLMNLISGQELSDNTLPPKPALSYNLKVDVDGKPTSTQIFLESISKLVNETHQSLEDKQPEIHWGELITYLNMLLLQAKMETIDLPQTKPMTALVTFDPSSQINLELDSGKQVTITNQRGDEIRLNQLTTSELHNLNSILDVMAGPDFRLDHVRTTITKLLSKR